MRVLLINDYGMPTGGAEILTLRLRDALRGAGHEALFFSSTAGGDREKLESDVQCHGSSGTRGMLLQVWNPFAATKLRRLLKEFRPDVAHVGLFLTQLSPSILPVLRRVPTIYHAHWYRAICPTGSKRQPDGTICQVPAGLVCARVGCIPPQDFVPLQIQARLLARWKTVFRLILADSDWLKRRLEAENFGSAEVVWNGVDICPARPALGADPVVAFAGRMVPEKGLRVLLEAFRQLLDQLPKARLLLLGDGIERQSLEATIIRLKLTDAITWKPWLPHPEMQNFLTPSWVQVVPSLWEEPFGMAAIDAMMRGSAVIASRIGGLTEIVLHGETGHLTPPGDIGALAEALLRICGDRETAERLGRAARERALAHFTEARCLAQHVEWFEKVRAGYRKR